MRIAIDKIVLNYYMLCFYRNEKFTNSSLTNFGKSLENLPALNSISFNFGR